MQRPVSATADAPRASSFGVVLGVLGAAQFLMVLDTAVMNVSISNLVEDLDTEVTTIQAVITFYALVMAAFMILGAKVGDRIGRRRAFGLGLVIYGAGSLITAVAPTVGVLTFGWSLLEGLGAALVLPALAALVGGNFVGQQRAAAYGLIGGISGAGVAVGPILGGWVTTNLSWRYVFAGEVVVVIGILAMLHRVGDTPVDSPPRIDGRGAVLSASGIALVVFGVLQAGSWGWLQPRNVPFEVFGFSPTFFVIGLGAALLYLFVGWQRRLEAQGGQPLVRIALFGVPSIRSGLAVQLLNNLCLLGIFFTIPLYLQVVQGLSAFDTGVRLLPVSVMMIAASLAGPKLAARAGARAVMRAGAFAFFVAAILLVATIQPELDGVNFAIVMGLIGLSLGLIVSQTGNVLQAEVGDDQRGEVGGLQNTAVNLGSSLGTALVGALLIGALASTLGSFVEANPNLSTEVKDQASAEISAGVEFVTTDQVEAAVREAGADDATTESLVSDYSDAQIRALKSAILGVAFLVLFLLVPATGSIPRRIGLPPGTPSDEAIPA